MDFDNNLDNSPPNTGLRTQSGAGNTGTGAPFGRTSSLFAHIIAEVVVVGGVSLYFYNKITQLENVVETLKTELEETKALLFHRSAPDLRSGIHQPAEAYLPNPPITSINPLNRPNSATSLLRMQPPGFGSSAREYPIFEENVAAIGHFSAFGPMTGGSSAREGEATGARSKQSVTLNRPLAGAFTETEQNCEGGVCKLKRVAISKVSTQREIGGNTSKVKTFTTKSPNPVLKSVTPSLSTSFEGLWPDDRSEFEEVRLNVAEPENSLNKVLNDIDDE
jgi:hypothetical protein